MRIVFCCFLVPLLWSFSAPAAGQGRSALPFSSDTLAVVPAGAEQQATLEWASTDPMLFLRRIQTQGEVSTVSSGEIEGVSSAFAEHRAEETLFWNRYSNWGLVIGGAAGLAYGLATDDNNAFLDLSPMIETVIGAGIGAVVGTAVFLVKWVR